MATRATKNHKRVGASNVNDWAAALVRAVHRRAEDVPDGFLKASEVMDKLGLCRSRTTKALQAMIKCGEAEMKVFRVASCGSTRPIPHYRLIKGATKSR